MNDLYPSGSILVFYFSGISGSAFLSNNFDDIPVNIKDDKGYIKLDKPIHKSELINDYFFLRTDGNYLTKYKMRLIP